MLTWFPKVKNNRSVQITFVSAVLFGILSQGIGLFNKLSFHDDIYCTFSVGFTYGIGRWMLAMLGKLEELVFGAHNMSLPLYNGAVAIASIAIASALIVDLLKIQKKSLSVFIGGIMVAFPTVTGFFAYGFCLHFYFIAMCLTVWGGYIICENKHWISYIVGIIIIGFAVGVYQAFVPMAIAIMLLYMIRQTAFERQSSKWIIRKGLMLVASIALAMVVYFACNKLCLYVMNATMSNYKGAESMGKASLAEYLTRIAQAYQKHFSPERDVFPGRIKYLYLLVVFLNVVFAFLAIKRIFKMNKLTAFLLTGLFILIPLASNFIYVMVGVEVTALMAYAEITPFLLFALLAENYVFSMQKATKPVAFAMCAFLMFVDISYCRYDNGLYLKAQFTQQEAISYFTTLIAQIKNTEGYKDEYPVVFLNSENINDLSLTDVQRWGENQPVPYDQNLNDYVNSYSWLNFMAMWCGYDPVVIEEENYMITSEIDSMPHYPDYGSIRVIDDTVVVKF